MHGEDYLLASIELWHQEGIANERGIFSRSLIVGIIGVAAGEAAGDGMVAKGRKSSDKQRVMNRGMPGARDEDNSWKSGVLDRWRCKERGYQSEEQREKGRVLHDDKFCASLGNTGGLRDQVSATNFLAYHTKTWQTEVYKYFQRPLSSSGPLTTTCFDDPIILAC